MSKHSNIVGGSTCGRLLACPGSFQATQALPPSADSDSVFAAEGSAMHAVMDMLMRDRVNTGRTDSAAVAEKMIGATAVDRSLTRDHLDTMIHPALDALAELEDTYGGGFRVAAVEMRVRFPGIPGAFGTADLLLVSDTHAIVCDWKFGQGVPVSALYVDDDNGDLLNPQLMYYLTGAINSAHRLFVRRKLVIAIIQPRTSEPLTHTEVTRKDVKFFREDLERAVQAAVDRNPPLSKGEHCRWCPAKIACPLWTTPILGLAEAIGEKVGAPDDGGRILDTYGDYGTYLAKAKAFVDLLQMYTREVNDQLHSYLEQGGQVPGWRLKAKAKMRQWVDENVVDEELRRLGFHENEIWQDKLQTFQVAERAAKRLGVSIPDHLRVAPESTETTIAPTNDPAPVVDRALAQQEFTAALRKLT